MKNSFLEELFFCNISISEQLEPNKKYLASLKICDKLSKELNSGFNKEQKDKFEKFIDACEELEYESSVQYFKAGFKIAFRLAAESISDEGFSCDDF